MRTRTLSLLAAACLGIGAALVAVPTATVAAGEFFSTCTSPEQWDCIESATANGAATAPGSDGTVRDFPYAKPDPKNAFGLEIGALHDSTGDGTALGSEVDPAITYTLVVRATVDARELVGTLRSARFSQKWVSYEQRLITVTFSPTPVARRTGTCVVGSCGTSTTKATSALAGFARGYLHPQSSTVPGDRYAPDQNGLRFVTDAQAWQFRANYVNHTFVVDVANPARRPDGTLTPGSFELLLPHTYVELRLEMPDVRTAGKSRFVVTRLVGKKNVAVPYTLVQESNGIRFRFAGIPYPTATYRIHPKISVPGAVRSGGAPVAKTRTSVGVHGYYPWASGGTPIDRHQGRCKVIGTTKWFYAGARSSYVVVGGLPRAAVAQHRIACQLRAHNAHGYGAFSKLEPMLPLS